MWGGLLSALGIAGAAGILAIDQAPGELRATFAVVFYGAYGFGAGSAYLGAMVSLRAWLARLGHVGAGMGLFGAFIGLLSALWVTCFSQAVEALGAPLALLVESVVILLVAAPCGWWVRLPEAEPNKDLLRDRRTSAASVGSPTLSATPGGSFSRRSSVSVVGEAHCPIDEQSLSAPSAWESSFSARSIVQRHAERLARSSTAEGQAQKNDASASPPDASPTILSSSDILRRLPFWVFVFGLFAVMLPGWGFKGLSTVLVEVEFLPKDLGNRTAENIGAEVYRISIRDLAVNLTARISMCTVRAPHRSPRLRSSRTPSGA